MPSEPDHCEGCGAYFSGGGLCGACDVNSETTTRTIGLWMQAEAREAKLRIVLQAIADLYPAARGDALAGLEAAKFPYTPEHLTKHTKESMRRAGVRYPKV